MAMLQYGQAEEGERQPHSFLIDSLFCEEEKWEDDEAEQEEQTTHLFPSGSLEGEGLFWEDEQLQLLSMLSKEKEQQRQTHLKLEALATDPSLLAARSSAVEWMLKVKSHYGFSTLTAILAVEYFDRFLSSIHFRNDKPWMNQLVAVSCLSLAAKVEEIQVPLLLDLQVEDATYVFEAKTIQRMELLVLSTLQWRMHPVTTYSFLDHIVGRIGFKTNLHSEFFRRSEQLLLSLLLDSRFVGYLPSALATAAMMEVIDQIAPHRSMEHQDQLLGVLKMTKETVQCCYNLVVEHSKAYGNSCYYDNNANKRKYEQQQAGTPGSPSGVIDAGFNSDSSNDSWELRATASPPAEPSFKKSKTEESKMKFHSLNRVFLDIVGSPS